jgi:uncharacterized membrane protein
MSSKSKLVRAIVGYFVRGLFYVVPLGVTIYVLFYAVVFVDGLIHLEIPGLGILLILLLITVIGYLGSHYLFSYLRPFERTIENTPLIKIIYSATKDMMNAFVGKKKQFKKPVLVKLGEGIDAERIGFITKDDLEELDISPDKVCVYFPFSYAISGQVLIVPRKNITPLNVSSTDVMKLIISGGVTSVHQVTDKKSEHVEIDHFK